MHLLARRRRPEDHIAGATQARPSTKKVATHARLPGAEDSDGVSKSLAVAAIENAALRSVDAVAVLVENNVGIRCVGTASSGLEEVDRRAVPKCVAVCVDVRAHRQRGKVSGPKDVARHI